MTDDLLKDADAKLEQNEIELLGCYDVHPEPYENNLWAADARRAFLDHLLAPFFARIRELEARCCRLTEDRDRAIEWRDHDKTRAETAEAEVARLRDALTGAGVHIENLLSVMATPDTQMCCDGRMCGCQGATVYQEAEYFAREELRTIRALTAPSAKPEE
jgi:hypothetical protein